MNCLVAMSQNIVRRGIARGDDFHTLRRGRIGFMETRTSSSCSALSPLFGLVPTLGMTRDRVGGAERRAATKPRERRVPPGFRSKVTLIFGRRTRAANDPLEEQAVGHL